ncbi:MAG TPA: carboxypeptidase regulatory-like domain-containing protein [Burkholderiales bacterium]|nr:carboxypeptidase regulatory-like domain-containing protein [Burkholderiales bacterium]
MLRRFLGVLLALWAPLALAQAPLVQAQGKVRYVSGGIGVGERLELAAMHAEFNVHMTFAVRRAGNYLADVAVRVEDASGRALLDALSDGPWLYARLAPGRYRLRAAYAGVEQTRAFQVRAGGHTELYLYWDDPSAHERHGTNAAGSVPAERRQ